MFECMRTIYPTARGTQRYTHLMRDDGRSDRRVRAGPRANQRCALTSRGAHYARSERARSERARRPGEPCRLAPGPRSRHRTRSCQRLAGTVPARAEVRAVDAPADWPRGG